MILYFPLCHYITLSLSFIYSLGTWRFQGIVPSLIQRKLNVVWSQPNTHSTNIHSSMMQYNNYFLVKLSYCISSLGLGPDIFSVGTTCFDPGVVKILVSPKNRSVMANLVPAKIGPRTKFGKQKLSFVRPWTCHEKFGPPAKFGPGPN